MFNSQSRYFSIEQDLFTLPDGRQVAYVRRRFLPDPSIAITLAQHTVMQGERLDNITARYLSDPEQFWRVCDVNYAMNPDELTAVVGRQLRVPFPQI
jgi:hypothetical protein